MAIEPQDLHFLMVPLLSQSHIIPLIDFSVLLARRGVLVSVLSTPLNAARSQQLIDRARAQNLRIRTPVVDFPGAEAGLPEGCENLDCLGTMALAGKFFMAFEKLREPVEALFQQLEPKPNCIVSTTAVCWTQAVADKFNIPNYVFETVSCFTISCSGILQESRVQDTTVLDSDTFLIPNIPHRIEFTRAQLPKLPKKDPASGSKMLDKINQARVSTRGFLVNTFQELEPWYVEEFKRHHGKVYPIGPVPLCNSDSIQEHPCLKWLDSQKQASVIYACFGSLSEISYEQMKEIGLGLESSGYPFIWVIRKSQCSESVEKWFKDEGLELRTKDRGLIIKGWVPQFTILQHPSVGGFITHCGWNSTLEDISAGLPMITWPMFAEQFYNEKYAVDVLGIGVRLGTKQLSMYYPGNAIKSDQIEKAIRELMNPESLEAIARRRRAAELRKMAIGAVEENGSSWLNMSKFIEDVILAIS